MTRKSAREIALGCIFECFSRREEPNEILDQRLTKEAIADLADEAIVYQNDLTEKDAAYIREVVVAAVMNADKYYAAVDVRSQSWSRTRIARMTRAILCLALAEIEYLKDVPPSVAVNEAVELAKQYDTEKAPSYINGILGSYLRDRAEPESAQ
ncbi:MAG: transcription antitermination factor NusB [Clostridia bacterium]|nr:transcription antitermination factor NusB [Clostridia bacterium]MBR7136655.1 transcription antitermination factor NusB [Clostridia bacterium]